MLVFKDPAHLAQRKNSVICPGCPLGIGTSDRSNRRQRQFVGSVLKSYVDALFNLNNQTKAGCERSPEPQITFGRKASYGCLYTFLDLL